MNAENKDETTDEIDMNFSTTPLRMLVLANGTNHILPALTYLKNQGYKIKLLHHVMDSVQELTKSKPDVLLISWHLKRTDVKKAYKILSSKFDTLCIVFGEENNSKTSKAIMASGIPHTILPPVSGPGIHMRVQTLMRMRNAQGPRIESKMQIKFNDVQSDLEDTVKEKFESQPVSKTDPKNEIITVLKPKDEKNNLAKGIKKAVAQSIMPTDNTDPNMILVQTKITVTTLKTSQFQGYLVGAHAEDIPDRKLMEMVLKNLGTTMQDLGEPLKFSTKILSLEVDPIPFMLWVDSKAEFFVRSQHGNNEIAYAYLPFLNMPEVVEAKDNDDLIGIKLSSLNPGKPVPFEVYIFMPKNDKYLLYIKDNTTVTTKMISKLIRFGIKHVYIKKIEEDSYHTYCAKYKIAEAYEDFKDTAKKRAG